MPFSSAVGSFSIGDSPIGGAFTSSSPTLPPTPFFAIEIETFKPGAINVTPDVGHGTHAHGMLWHSATGAIESTGTIRASDVGYRSSPSDVGGAVPYPPFLNQPLQIDVALNLDPAQSSVAAAWGPIELSNATREYDTIVRSWNSDGRPVRVWFGEKPFDTDRQYWTDPPFSTLSLLFSGLATPWFLDDTKLTIPLRDATYWLERPYQTSLYGGTGGYDGAPELTGKPLPRTRGGTGLCPVRNVTPTLLDPVHLIYQYSDGPGAVAHVYEGAAEVFLYSGDTTDLYSGVTSAGCYRSDNSRGLFQLGSSPAHGITADVFGFFPFAGSVPDWAQLVRRMLTEDMQLPTSLIDVGAFSAAASAYPYISGIYVSSEEPILGVDAIDRVMAGLYARLVPFADGTLRPFVLREVSGFAVATFDLANIISIVPVPLPPAISPPPFRIRVGYNQNYTVQTSDLNTASASTAQLAFVPLASQVASWSSSAILLQYRRPNDPPIIRSALTRQSDAQAIANDIGALIGTYRRLYDVTVPVGALDARDIGDVVSIKYPIEDLDAGKTGQIVRRALSLGVTGTGSASSGSPATYTYRVLI